MNTTVATTSIFLLGALLVPAVSPATQPCLEAPPTEAEAPCTDDVTRSPGGRVIPQLPNVRPNPQEAAADLSASVGRAINVKFGTDNYDDVWLNGRTGKDLEHSSAPVYSQGIDGGPGMDLDPALLKKGIKRSLAKGSSPEETAALQRGQNMWVGVDYGSQGFWGSGGGETISHGMTSLLTAIDSRQPVINHKGEIDGTQRLDTEWKPDANGKNGRYQTLGIQRAPGFAPMLDADGRVMPDENGLFLDQPSAAAKVHYGQLDPSVYGVQSPVLGLMMRKHPAFDKTSPHYNPAAVKLWNEGLEPVEYKDPKTGKTITKMVNTRYYNDPSYYGNPNLITPVQTGMTCGFCHVAAHPNNPPADNDYPKMENLTSMNGQPYLRERFFLYSRLKPDNILMQMENHAVRPGTNDTSLFIPQDHRRNHKQMNGSWELAARHALATTPPNDDPNSSEYKDWFRKRMVKVDGETLEALKLIPGNPYQIPADVTEYHIPSPYVLADGADRAGLYFALLRVPHNIGLAWQETMQKANPVIGVHDQHPMDLVKLFKTHPWEQFSLKGVGDEAKFLLKSPSFRLGDRTDGHELLAQASAHPDDSKWFKSADEKLAHGKTIFADKCAHCHSSKQPDPNAPDQRAEMRKLVHSPDFLKGNFLSTDLPVPVTDVKTWATRAFATNAISAEADPDGNDGDLWYNWTSSTYRNRRKVGALRVFDPLEGEYTVYQPELAGGTGYYRVNPLNGIWSRGGFMNNKQIGGGSTDPALNARINDLAMSPKIADRIEFYNISMDQMLNPQKRRGLKSIPVTQGKSVLRVPGTVLPSLMRKLFASPEMAWDGKTIDPTKGVGINRMHIPGRDEDGDGQPDLGDRWPFRIGKGASKLDPSRASIVLDYGNATCADAPAGYEPCQGCEPGQIANPEFIRKIHDELRRVEVQIGDGTRVPVYMGPAMWKRNDGTVSEVLWFALAPKDGSTQNHNAALNVLAAKTADELREMYKNEAKSPTNDAGANAMLTELAGVDGRPKGRALAVNRVSQGATDGPLHAILASLGLPEVPSLEVPIPEGTPIDLIMNVAPWKLKPVMQQLLKSAGPAAPTVLEQYKALPADRQKAIFQRYIAPLLQKASSGPFYVTDGGHPYGVLPGKPGATASDPQWFGDPETNARPYDPTSNPNGTLSDRDKEALRAYGLRW